MKESDDELFRIERRKTREGERERDLHVRFIGNKCVATDRCRTLSAVANRRLRAATIQAGSIERAREWNGWSGYKEKI